ncbi:unnamed protein product [Gordionus sp. m RMFG-2023]
MSSYGLMLKKRVAFKDKDDKLKKSYKQNDALSTDRHLLNNTIPGGNLTNIHHHENIGRNGKIPVNDSSMLEQALSQNIDRNVANFRTGTSTTEDKTPELLRDSFSSGGIDHHDDSSQEDAQGIPLTRKEAVKIITERQRKIGHRRVDDEGKVTYKKVESSQLLKAIQLGLNHSIGSLSSKPQRDVLMQDFTMIEMAIFPRDGSSTTAAHEYSEFRFKTYAPVAFRYFRELFGIKTDDFLISLCARPPRELSNPGASGSVFFVTCDDEFILKTVQRKEAGFLEKLLPGYYMSGGKNIRLLIMNNLIPSSIKIHEKYDLKGSTYNRKASKYERLKNTPTYKDLDFMEKHPQGIMLEPDTYDALIKTLKRDCLVLESFKIMDYSFLMGVHNLDLTLREKELQANEKLARQNKSFLATSSDSSLNSLPNQQQGNLTENLDVESNKHIKLSKRVTAFSTAMESIQAQSEPIDIEEEQDAPRGGIPARNAQGERLLCFIGIIDILQCYELKKKLEHTFKSIFHDGDTVSVHRPSFYAQRFKDFVCNKVFKKIPSLDKFDGKSPYKTFRKFAFATMATVRHPTFSMIPNINETHANTPIPNVSDNNILNQSYSIQNSKNKVPIHIVTLPNENENYTGNIPHKSPFSLPFTALPEHLHTKHAGAIFKKIIHDGENKTHDNLDLINTSSFRQSKRNKEEIMDSGESNIRRKPSFEYKYPLVTWKKSPPSDLTLIDQYGLRYDSEIEDDIGPELYEKANLEDVNALKPIISTANDSHNSKINTNIQNNLLLDNKSPFNSHLGADFSKKLQGFIPNNESRNVISYKLHHSTPMPTTVIDIALKHNNAVVKKRDSINEQNRFMRDKFFLASLPSDYSAPLSPLLNNQINNCDLQINLTNQNFALNSNTLNKEHLNQEQDLDKPDSPPPDYDMSSSSNSLDFVNNNTKNDAVSKYYGKSNEVNFLKMGNNGNVKNNEMEKIKVDRYGIPLFTPLISRILKSKEIGLSALNDEHQNNNINDSSSPSSISTLTNRSSFPKNNSLTPKDQSIQNYPNLQNSPNFETNNESTAINIQPSDSRFSMMSALSCASSNNSSAQQTSSGWGYNSDYATALEDLEPSYGDKNYLYYDRLDETEIWKSNQGNGQGSKCTVTGNSYLDNDRGVLYGDRDYDNSTPVADARLTEKFEEIPKDNRYVKEASVGHMYERIYSEDLIVRKQGYTNHHNQVGEITQTSNLTNTNTLAYHL